MEQLLSLYERLASLCESQMRLLAADDMQALETVLEEKDVLLEAIAQENARTPREPDHPLLPRVLAAAEKAAHANAETIEALQAQLATLRQRLRQAGYGRDVVRSYSPGSRPASRWDGYSA